MSENLKRCERCYETGFTSFHSIHKHSCTFCTGAHSSNQHVCYSCNLLGHAEDDERYHKKDIRERRYEKVMEFAEKLVLRISRL
jgi:hypothetical protein